MVEHFMRITETYPRVPAKSSIGIFNGCTRRGTAAQSERLNRVGGVEQDGMSWILVLSYAHAFNSARVLGRIGGHHIA